MKNFRLLLSILLLLSTFQITIGQQNSIILLEDEFNNLRPGIFSSDVGAHTEYHYLPQAAPKGNWAVSAFTWELGAQRAWRILQEDGKNIMAQTFDSREKTHTHPILVAGDSLWEDYSVKIEFAPESKRAECGLMFRYENDRCYYFFGVQGDSAVLKLVKHGIAFRKPFEKILAIEKCEWPTEKYLTAKVTVSGRKIQTILNDKINFLVEDATFSQGKIGLLSDVPAKFRSVKVTTSEKSYKKYSARKEQRLKEAAALQAKNPKMSLWKKLTTYDFGMGRNLRFGDLNNDGRIDVLIGQVQHHGPSDRYSELSCMTAMTFEGEQLWQVGSPDKWKTGLTNDVGFQIHDLDGDGKNEVIYCMNFEIIVGDAATGKTKYKAPTPLTDRADSRYPRILGDCLFFCDLRGTRHDRDIIIKDRYWQLWALNDKLETMWTGKCRTGHYPFAYDIDDDGKDEIAIGYSLFDNDGTPLWSLDEQIEDHADGVAIIQMKSGAEPILFNAASDEGMFFTDLKGNIFKHHYLGHVQNPAAANFRDDLPGLEIVSINFWNNQGILNFYDANGNIYQSTEPAQYGSMCLPINWTGNGEEYFVLSPDVTEGGLFDGWGRRVVLFPGDGHPDMCNAVLDITGDCRDEIVVWDPYEIWVYTQDDNPKSGKLYKPERNALYNYSNYQATVSLPGWAE